MSLSLRVLIICCVASLTAAAQEPVDKKPVDKKPIDKTPAQQPSELVAAAQQAFEMALRDFQTGKSASLLQLEVVNAWSVRLLRAEMLADFPIWEMKREQVEKVFERYHARLKRLEAIIQKRVDGGVTGRYELAAITFFRYEGDALMKQMQAAKELEEERQLDVVLPPAAQAKPLTAEPKTLTISIDANGKLFLAGNATDAKQLGEMFQAAAQQPIAVIIRADKNTQFQHVVAMIGLCNQHGIEDYSMAVK